MAYKWRPNKTARREFAQRMQNPDEREAYEARKRTKEDRKRSDSLFDYGTAGGYYIPTKEQHDFCLKQMGLAYAFDKDHENNPIKAVDAFNLVMYGYSCKEKVSHDYIHVVNELRRHNL